VVRLRDRSGRGAGAAPALRQDPPIAAVEPAEIESLRHGLNAILRRLR
jgi:hypothetical protein